MIAAEDEVKLILKHAGGAVDGDTISRKEAEMLVNEVEADSKWMRTVIVLATLAIWVILVIGTLMYTFRSAATANTFVELATKILIPLYQSTIAAVIAYVFGKPVTKAIVRRLL